MNKKIFRSTCLVAFFVFLLSLVMIFGILFGHFESMLTKELKSEAEYIAKAVDQAGEDYLSAINSYDARITLISPDGTVLFDSVADPSSMGNHLGREEVQKALKYGAGESSRISNTFTEKTYYYAVKTANGDILRLSNTQFSIFQLLLSLLQPMAFVCAAALIIAAVLSSKVSKSIVAPINSIDLENPENSEVYDELSPLLTKIANQKKAIDRQIKEAMKNQERFRIISENMSEGFAVTDSEGHLLTYNKVLLNILGMEEKDTSNILKYNRSNEFIKCMEEVLDGRHSECTINVGQSIYSVMANPVFDGTSVIGSVIVLFDITSKIEGEKMRREFTANVSHELKTPLTSISGFAEIIKNGGLPREVVEDFSVSIYEEAQRLITLVNDIIKLSKLDEESSIYSFEQVDLHDVANRVVSRLKNDAEGRNLTVSVIGGSATVPAVLQITEEMIYNLVDNAIKYNKEGGNIDILINDSQSSASIIVRDTGIGIPLSHQSRVFERFYRVDKSHSKEIGGTGLGLSIVKHGAMYMGASVKLESEEGKGTSVCITFKK